MVKNDTMELKDKTLLQHLANNLKFTVQKGFLIDKAFDKMLKKEIIKENTHEEVKFSQNLTKVYF